MASDHYLLLGTVRIKLKKCADSANGPQQQYNVHKLKSREIKLVFNCAVRNRFEAVEDMTEDSIEVVWATLQEIWKGVFKKVLGKRERKHKVWLSTVTWTLIKEMKQMVNRCKTVKEKQEHQAKCWHLNKAVKKSTRKEKKNYINDLLTQAEMAAHRRDMKEL